MALSQFVSSLGKSLNLPEMGLSERFQSIENNWNEWQKDNGPRIARISQQSLNDIDSRFGSFQANFPKFEMPSFNAENIAQQFKNTISQALPTFPQIEMPKVDLSNLSRQFDEFTKNSQRARELGMYSAPLTVTGQPSFVDKNRSQIESLWGGKILTTISDFLSPSEDIKLAARKFYSGENITPEEAKKLKDNDMLNIGLFLSGPAQKIKPSAEIKNIFQKMIKSSPSQDEAIQRIDSSMDGVYKSFGDLFTKNADEALGRLKNTRAAINQIINEAIDVGGRNFKEAFKFKQQALSQPEFAHLAELNNHVNKIDDVLKGMAREKLGDLINYPGQLVSRGYQMEDINKIGYRQAMKILRENIPPPSRLNDLREFTGNMSGVERSTRGFKKAGELIKDSLSQGDIADAKRLQNVLDENFTKVSDKVNFFDYFRTPDRVLQKIGLGNEAKILRTQYDKYLAELPQEIKRITDWSNRVPKESAQRIFETLDGKSVGLTEEESKVAGEIQDYLVSWADRLNLPKDKRISNYITHIFEKGSVEKEFNDEIAKLIDQRVAGSVYNPFLQARQGKKIDYIRNVWTALDAYVKRGVRKANMDPALELLKKKVPDLELSQMKYLERLTSEINLRPTEIDTLIDNFIKSVPVVGYKFGQRPVTAITQSTRRIIYRGTIGMNVSSAIRNLSQSANTYAELGERWTVTGLLKMAKNWFSGELERVGVLRDSFIQDRNISYQKKFLEKVDRGLFFLFEKAEKVNRGIAYYGAKSKALNQGMTEEKAIEYAKEIVRKTQFTFGSIDTPLALSSDIMKTVFQLQSYNIKQFEFLADKVKKKEFLGIIRYVGSMLVMGKVLKDAFGMRLDLLPMNFNLTPSLQIAQSIGQITFGDEQSKAEGWKNLQRAGWTTIPAGVQIKKTFEGTKAFQEGGSFTPTGRLRFPIEPTELNKFRTGIFGQYAVPEAQDYFKSLLPKEKFPKQTGVKAAEDSGEFSLAQTVSQRKKEDEQRTFIRDLLQKGYTEEKAMELAKKRGIDYNAVALSIVQNLDTADRGRYVMSELKKTTEKDKTFKDLVDNKILTSGVVDALEEAKKLTASEADAMKTKIKTVQGKATGTRRIPAKYKLRAMPKLQSVKITAPRLNFPPLKPLKVSAAAYKPRFIKLRKVKFPKFTKLRGFKNA